MLKKIKFYKKSFILSICLTIFIYGLTSNFVLRCFAEESGPVTDFSSLQAAINSSNGNPIEIANDIQLDAAITINKDIMLTAAQGVGEVKLIVTGSRHFNVSGGDITLTFDGHVTLDGGSSAGGINCTASNLTLNNAVIQNCVIIMNGGGVFASHNITVNGCTFNNNSGGNGGGGAIWSSGDLTIYDTTFIRNTSFVGAGVYAVGDATVYNSVFTGNTAPHNGAGGNGNSGGGAICSRGSIVVDNCTINDNKAGNGGGICSYQSTANDTLIVRNGTKITGNQSLSPTGSCGGGAIYSTNSRVIIEDGEITGNTSVTGGGAIYSDGGLVVTGGVISGNTAGTGGGAARVYGPVMAVSGGEISGNTAERYGGAIMTGADNATVSGNARIIGNIANGADVYDGGGGLSLYYCTLTVSGGEISGNTAAHANGGGIDDYWGSTVNVTGGSIVDNHAPEGDGGGIYITDLTKVTAASDALFSGNTASRAFWMTDPGDIALHDTNIHTISRSAPPVGNKAFTYLFNNYDVNYTKGNFQDTLLYTVTYDANGAAGTPPEGGTYPAGTVVTVAGSNTLVLTGYMFAGWKDGSGNHYAEDDTFIINSNVILYAQWEKAAETVYTVTYDANGAHGTPPTSMSYAAGTVVIVAGQNTLVLTGYTFAGWKDSGGKLYMESDTFKINSDIIFYAQWIKINGGGSGATVTGEPSTPNPLPLEPTPSNELPTPLVPGHSIIPGENGTYIEINENGVPMEIWKENENHIWIYEELPPLSGNPGTGGSNLDFLRMSEIFLILSSLLLIAIRRAG